ncbi:proline dehydrogenase family protein [Corynebacterium bovis]|uniref:proline dehydrogenase family protein n=1 Tax=Corynebacterium bovis TaxID=36808 RepID=UPI000F652DC5|nr:proline dehydrogenase family protein [Corynebacterium bovis]RRO81608.1 aldehyde dehydrogenase [Corynebacterium bovis]RRO82913.1 aldehyde dehydrogenase [Corynebacterium bovis]RRO83939.1 aldehyde dehydrogenase [Corynebacterium bovis]RRO92712.1 aldehyde dehydrogenase [Corynebacterium bovis]RRQ15955.1 aldehyde dehydrogenase [Corynebacterium bovis]
MTTFDLDAHTPPPDTTDVEASVQKAIHRAEKWLAVEETSSSTKQLAAMVHDPDGVEFTFAFVDRVARPEDNRVAAREFAKIAHPLTGSRTPAFLGLLDTVLVTVGAVAAPLLPNIVMPVARRYLRAVVGHLVLDAESAALDRMLDDARDRGFRLNLNMLGEAVLGEAEAQKRLDDITDLLRNPRVDYVSVKASAVVSQLNHWDLDGSTERLKDRLRPLYRQALRRDPHPFINMDMEEYKDLELTLRLFTELLDEEEFRGLEAGIVLQAYLPDTFDALTHLAAFARDRVARGGAPIKVRIVKGANLSMERVDSELHDWPQAPYLTKAEVDANYVRLLDWVLRPEHADHIRIGVASHNLYHVALAHELSVARNVEHQIDVEMLQGMAPAQAEAVREVTGDLILYTPVVRRESFDVAVSYLVRRLEENGAKQNFLYALFTPEDDDDTGQTPMQAQEQRFLNSVRDRWTTFAGPRRDQDRTAEARDHRGVRSDGIPGNFVNEPDTDPSLPANRAWARGIVDPASDPGPAQTPVVTDPDRIDAHVARCVAAGEEWARRSGAERAALLDRAADALADNRGRLIAAAVAEAGKTVGETDAEVSEAIDFARYYAESARALDHVTGSEFHPYRCVVVTPPWNFPLAIPMGGCFAALAAGGCVILKPAPQVLRIAEEFTDVLRGAGVTEDMLQLVNADEGDAGRRLISHPDVGSVILTGASETAKLFRGWRPRMVVNAETSGKNAIIVTPAADPDLAVADIYRSAFSHAGQKCSAASLIITVGSMGESERFMNQLVDAVRSIHVGRGNDLSTWMNGLIEPPGEKLLRGLTRLDKGERWLVTPRKLSADGTLWSPGLRDGVKPGSWFHTHECFGPVAGIMHARDLDEAIEWQNSTGFGLTGGIHTIDRDEAAYWRERVEVGNAYVERGITGAIVQRQSFGGWKNSSIGGGAKAGGPNYVAQQGVWREGDVNSLVPGTLPTTITQLLREFRGLGSPVLSTADTQWLRRAAESDAHAWSTEFGVEHDNTALVTESNVFRYRPLLTPLRIRVHADAAPRDVLRLHLAAAITGTEIDVSSTVETAASMGELGMRFRTCTDEEFAAAVAVSPSTRVRAVGTAPDGLYEAAVESGSVILDQDVLPDGRRELLPFLLEQAVSTTEHRFGYIHGLTP